MTTIIGIFDNARDLDKAVNKLARAGFDETVYDESIVAEDALKGNPIAFALGHTPATSGAMRSRLCHPNRTAAPSFGRLKRILPITSFRMT